MKKLKLSLILALPIFLLGAIMWARQAEWKRLDAEFQATMTRVRFAPHGLQMKLQLCEPYADFGSDLGTLSAPEIKALSPRMHLRKATAPREDSHPWRLHFEGEDAGFFIPLDGTAEESRTDWVNNRDETQWPGLELTPQSCRILRQTAQARFGRKIALLQRLTSS